MFIKIIYICDKTMYMRTFVVHKYLNEWKNVDDMINYFHHRIQSKMNKPISLKQMFICNHKYQIVNNLILRRRKC